MSTSSAAEAADSTPEGGDAYSIGELAREFDVTTRAIRYYESEGLLSPERIGRTRVYGPRDRVHLRLILRGKRLGFSLREVREMLELYDAPDGEVTQLRHFIAKMRERRRTLVAQRRDIDNVLEELGELERRCAAALARKSAT